MKSALSTYLLHLADNSLILGQRLGEWCGHGPVLEQDIAMTNIALDQIGQARLIFQYAAELDGTKNEDDLAFLRLEQEYLNILLVEQPNGNFADTIVRQYFFSSFQFLLYQAMAECRDERLCAIAEKALKEVAYHRRWSQEWVIRLGDGTIESHEKTQAAVEQLWPYTGEMFVPAEYERICSGEYGTPEVATLKEQWHNHISNTLDEATLQLPPDNTWMQSGGKSGRHSEHLGYILTELQYMQRTYPQMQW